MTCPRCWAGGREDRDGNPCPNHPTDGMPLNSHNHPEAFKEARAQRGPGHTADLGDYSNSGLSPKPNRAFLVPVTMVPNEKAKDTGHHSMDCRARSFFMMCPRSVQGQWQHMLLRTPMLAPEVTFTSGGKQISTSCLSGPFSSSLKGRRLWQSRLRAWPHHASWQRFLTRGNRCAPAPQLWEPQPSPASSRQTQPQTWNLQSEQQFHLQNMPKRFKERGNNGSFEFQGWGS